MFHTLHNKFTRSHYKNQCKIWNNFYHQIVQAGVRQPLPSESMAGSLLTHINFMATSLKPFCSNRLTISPTSPRWTPSGLIMMKVCSLSPDIVVGDEVIVSQGEVREQNWSWSEVLLRPKVVRRKNEKSARAGRPPPNPILHIVCSSIL